MSVLKISFLLLITAVMASQSVTAAGYREKDRSHKDHGISLERAVTRARDEYRGRVISAEKDSQNGQGTYKIRILTDDGRVRRIRVDPDTGEYIGPNRRSSGH